MQQELIDQGHKDTGELIQNLTPKVVSDATSVIGQIFAVDYGIYVNFGVAANRVNYNPYVLVPWVQRKIEPDEKKAIGIAFAIKKTHEREGIPSRKSFGFSNNGYRRNWIERSTEIARPEIDKIVNLSVQKSIRKVFDQIAA